MWHLPADGVYFFDMPTAKRNPNDYQALADSVPPATEIVTIEYTLGLLISAFTQGIGQLQGDVQGPRGLARTIGADVAVCHRVLAALKAHGALSERVSKWPGAAGVSLMAEQVGRCLKHPQQHSDVEQLAAAAEKYAKLIRDHGGTHSKLVRFVRRLEEQFGTGRHESTQVYDAARREIMRGAADLSGHATDFAPYISVVRPIPGNTEYIEGCGAHGAIGKRCHVPDVCIATTQELQRSEEHVKHQYTTKWSPLIETPGVLGALLPEFSSKPLPLMYKKEAGNKVHHVIDASAVALGTPLDFVFASKWSPDFNPQYSDEPVWTSGLRVRSAIKRMTMDVYVHRSMLSDKAPSIGAYFYFPRQEKDPRSLWQDRLPCSPKIELLTSLASARNSSWARHAELTGLLFHVMGWDINEFVGYRFEESAPIWGADYCMVFDVEKHTHKPRAQVQLPVATAPESAPSVHTQRKVDTRESLYLGMTDLKGVSAETSLLTFLRHPSLTNPARADSLMINGAAGVRRLQTTAMIQFNGLLNSSPAWRKAVPRVSPDEQAAVLREFCRPADLPIQAEVEGDGIKYTIAIENGRDPTPHDFFYCELYSRQTQSLDGKSHTCPRWSYATVEMPSERLVFDMLVHRDILIDAEPRIETYDTSITGVVNPSLPTAQRAMMNIRVQPVRIGMSAGVPACPGVPRYLEMLRTCCERMSWNLDDFHGYRCEVEYPVFGSQVCMVFDRGG